MKYLIYLTLIIIAIACAGFIFALVLYFIDQHDLKAYKEIDEEYNRKMIDKCNETREAGQCPNACEICAWGTRSKGGIIILGRDL